MNTHDIPANFLTHPVRIHLVGCGGTGSQLADQLASMETTMRQLGHPGFNVTLYDPDTVSRSNLGRQRFTAADVGHNKAILLTHRINAFYGLNWSSQPNAWRPHHHANLIITCTDKAAVRAAIGNSAFVSPHAKTCYWMDTGNAAANGQVVLGTLVRKPNNPHLPTITELYADKFTPEGVAAADADDQPSCGTADALSKQDWPVNRMAASLAAELLWMWFRHGKISYHGAFFQLNPARVQPLLIDPATWAFYGITPANPKKVRRSPRASA